MSRMSWKNDLNLTIRKKKISRFDFVTNFSTKVYDDLVYHERNGRISILKQNSFRVCTFISPSVRIYELKTKYNNSVTTDACVSFNHLTWMFFSFPGKRPGIAIVYQHFCAHCSRVKHVWTRRRCRKHGFSAGRVFIKTYLDASRDSRKRQLNTAIIIIRSVHVRVLRNDNDDFINSHEQFEYTIYIVFARVHRGMCKVR